MYTKHFTNICNGNFGFARWCWGGIWLLLLFGQLCSMAEYECKIKNAATVQKPPQSQ